MSSGERRANAADPNIRPYFFLSYARTPRRDPGDRENPDRWVHKLYKDLCDAILQMTDVQPAEAGFMDTENKLGAEWSPELMTAIKNCRVFVPLYSRRYSRVRTAAGSGLRSRGARSTIAHAAESALKPSCPPCGRGSTATNSRDRADAQYAHPGMGERYCADGFYGIMKLRNYRDDVPERGAPARRADHRDRRQERRACRRRRAAHGDSKDFESLQSAFGPTSARRTTDGKLRISVLAHDTSTLAAGPGKGILRRHAALLVTLSAGLSAASGRIRARPGQEVPGLRSDRRGIQGRSA